VAGATPNGWRALLALKTPKTLSTCVPIDSAVDTAVLNVNLLFRKTELMLIYTFILFLYYFILF
jgi:hypothetical protein